MLFEPICSGLKILTALEEVPAMDNLITAVCKIHGASENMTCGGKSDNYGTGNWQDINKSQIHVNPIMKSDDFDFGGINVTCITQVVWQPTYF